MGDEAVSIFGKPDSFAIVEREAVGDDQFVDKIKIETCINMDAPQALILSSGPIPPKLEWFEMVF